MQFDDAKGAFANTDTLSTQVGTLREGALAQWSAGFPGLLWQLEITCSRLHLLNEWQHPLLGKDTARLLKDSHYRRQVVNEADVPLFAEFFDVIAAGTSAKIVFRLREAPHLRFLLHGWPHPSVKKCFSGMLHEAPATMDIGEGVSTMRRLLSRASFPALEVDANTRRVLVSNQPAALLFGFDAASSGTDVPLENIFSGSLGRRIEQWVKHSQTYGSSWVGTCNFRTLGGNSFQAQVRISPSGEGGLRIAFMRVGENRRRTAPRQPSAMRNQAGQESGLRATLEAMLQQPQMKDVDGILFSDINGSRGFVKVYGVGEPFQNMQWGVSYTYEGTIAQDIERYALPYLVVDDSLDSIKSIDWVLFNPNGIRAYFAKPFFKSGRLHAIMIFASRTAGAFTAEGSESSDTLYAPFYPAFEHAVAQWRKRHKNAGDEPDKNGIF